MLIPSECVPHRSWLCCWDCIRDSSIYSQVWGRSVAKNVINIWSHFSFWQGEPGMPGVGVPGLKGEKVNIASFILHPSVWFYHTNLSAWLNPPLRRASAVCASQPRSGADRPTSKCRKDQEAIKANRALQVLLGLQDLELMANRSDCWKCP